MASAQPSTIHTRMWQSDWKTDRSAARKQVHRESTVRGNDHAPHDSLLQDLSLTGFRISVSLALKPGDEILVGLAGVGIRAATVVWSEDLTAGCQFVEPISQAEMDKTITASTVIESAFASAAKPLGTASERQIASPRMSARKRATIVLAVAMAAWALWIGAAASMVALILWLL